MHACSGVEYIRYGPPGTFSIDPLRARSVQASDAPMSQAVFCSLSDLRRMAKALDMDWALQKLSDGPDKKPELGPAPLLPKRQRKAPACYRDSSLAPGARSSSNRGSQQWFMVSPQDNSRHLAPEVILQGIQWGTPAGRVKGRTTLYLHGHQSNASPRLGLAQYAVQPQGGSMHSLGFQPGQL
ncbi:hypothetical protein NDU88_002219 [Pleurodeles waltl]|uniref:Uncharacterized protein n=1 Tax=Pleurodeles waltl TaxID=8319 RepID=A0AAV7LBU9_PLEWA|nr:hypothetical protein NDU88_002219 [Pleurodeles waltl]